MIGFLLAISANYFFGLI